MSRRAGSLASICSRFIDARADFVILLGIFTQAEIGEFDVPMLVDENIVWLEVPVNNSAKVQLFKRQDKLGDVISGHLLLKVPTFFQQIGKVSTFHVFHHHIKIFG